MPARPRRSTRTAVSAAALVLSAAALTACAAAQADSPKAAAPATGTPAATTTPPTDKPVEPPTGSATPTAGETAPPPADQAAPPASTAAPVPATSAPGARGGTSAPTPRASAAPAAPAAPQGAGTAAPETPLTAAVAPAGLAKLPIASTFGWKPDGPLSSQDIQGRKITLNECAAVSGAATWQQQGYVSAARNPAGQQLFSFATPEAAHAAYQQLVTDMGACQTASRQLQARQGVTQDAAVTRTAETSDGTSWSRQWTGVGGLSAPDRQTNHVYALQQGTALTLFQFDELAERPGPTHDTGTDAALLTALAALGSQH
ncbi:hypothetical protein ACIRS1_21125 [Kitasatospora sp. NPDC101176]|uniref:hypothetical protein n=1 Tax=Kitasatospora sp. NPDC101176 TaxID=3364099 RepID=UPI00382E8D8D